MEALQLLSYLREEKIDQLFRDTDNLARFNLTWKECSRKAPNCDPFYLEQFCNELYMRLTSLVTQAMCEIENLVSVLNACHFEFYI